ncbi:MAG: hypothetical protein Q4D98_02340 [Planctomycetia bacterium]|nr:hypothetical protein [Planctomycetia bacterium]
MEKEFTLTRILYNRICRGLKSRENMFHFAVKKGIPMKVISAVANGWKPDFPRRGRRPKGWKQEIPELEFLEKAVFSDTYARCPECGGMVRFPCLACATKRAGKVVRPRKMGISQLGLELSPDCYRRYLEIRERKQREELERNSREAEEREKAWEEERVKEKERYEKVCNFFRERDALDGGDALGGRVSERSLSDSGRGE